MSLLARVRILTKNLIVIGVIGVLVAGGMWFITGRMAQIDDAYSTFLEKDARAWAEISRVNRNVYELRYLMNRLINEQDTQVMKKIEGEIEKAFEENGKLTADVKTLVPAYTQQIDAISGQVAKLKVAMQGVVKLVLSGRDDANQVAKAQVDPIFDRTEKAATAARDAMNHGIKQGSQHLGNLTDSTIHLAWLAMMLILAVGAGIGFAISQFGISRPMRSLVTILNRMAKGEDIEVTGTERADEVGETARAVNGIKVMLAEKAQREAEEKAEQDRRASADREAAMQKMAEEFEAAVGGIVKAAVAGDFSQRVDLQGKTGLVLNIGTAINSLCENVAKALGDLITMLNALAEGNLTQRITAAYQGNFALLKDNANKTAERIGTTIAEIKASAAEVTNASAEISTSTTDLSQRTEEQAASLEETSASMEEISATVRKNAENAQAANQSAADTRTVAERGGQVVAKAVDAMAKIEESSRRISDIIGVIDEIARQTNLLALNAAVEAARAGEAGRGFAVVASEVRSLAQRSSQAAKDIKDLIVNSSGQVKEGVDLVNKAGASLNEIVDSIKKVAAIVSDIANASNEQASGIEQVGKALTQMDEVTQQNSALVEENAATAKTLEHQANAMDQRVAFFQIDGAVAVGQSAPPVAVKHAPPLPMRGPAAKAAKPAHKAQPAEAKKPELGKEAAPKRAGGPVGRMQAALATAVNEDADWKEF